MLRLDRSSVYLPRTSCLHATTGFIRAASSSRNIHKSYKFTFLESENRAFVQIGHNLHPTRFTRAIQTLAVAVGDQEGMVLTGA